MTSTYNELLSITDDMARLAKNYRHDDFQQPLAAWKDAAEEIGRAWSGSWIGYHANVYYKGLQPPPPGARFIQEWGLMPAVSHGSIGDWIEYDPKSITDEIYNRAGNPDLEILTNLYADTAQTFFEQKTTSISLLEISLSHYNDSFLKRMRDKIDSLNIMSMEREAKRKMPTGNIMSRDRTAMSQGLLTPQHIVVLARARVFQQVLYLVEELANLTRQSADHISRLRRSEHRENPGGVNTKVFIGHGLSPVWLELDRFLRDRLNLEVDEFNRVSPAGRSTKDRLSEMMDDAGFAFLVMTGEDEKPEGDRHPRMNVVHEAGLFQGRLGFERAIVLLEEGCEEFSNIAGLGQIRFPEGKIAATFEQIRMVLERGGLLGAPGPGASG